MMSETVSASARAPISRLDRFLAYLKEDGANQALRKGAAREALDVQEWKVAGLLIDEGLRVADHDTELLALSGLLHLQAPRYDEAGTALSTALRCGADEPDVRFNLAFARFMQRRHGAALVHLMDPKVSQTVPQALLLRARCLHHLRRVDEAVGDCHALLAREPDNFEARALLGLLLLELGRTEEARPHIAAALRADPQDCNAMLARACLERDAFDRVGAKRSFTGLVALHPDCGRAWHGLAMLELEAMNLDAARQHMARATESLPEDVVSCHLLGWIQLLQGDLVEAEFAFGRALARDADDAESHGSLAVVATLQGRDDDAHRFICRALRLSPRCVSAQYAELLLLQRRGRHEKALAILEAFLDRPTSGDDPLFRNLVLAHADAPRAGDRVPSHSRARH